MKFSKPITLAFLCFTGTGCLMTPSQRREDTLVRLAREFNDDLRWGRYEQAATVMPATEAPLFLSRAGLVSEELSLGDSDVESINFGSPTDSATVIAKINWYYKRDQVVKSTTLEQHWEFRDGGWLLVKQRRVRGDRFPLVLEPVPPPPAH